MKKIFVVLFTLVLLTGCEKSKKLDLTRIKNDLNNLEYNDQKIFEENTCYDLDRLERKYDLDISEFNDYLVCIHQNEASSNLYIIASYKKSKDKLKTELDKLIELEKNSFSNGYFPKELQKVENYYYKEYSNYLIYIVSDNNELVYKKIIEEKE